MALIIEDGTMPEGANAFVSVAEADAYLSARGLGWPLPESDVTPDANLAAKEAAIVRASDYLNTLAWRGAKADWNWPMSWPRKGANIPGSVDEFIPEDVVPTQVKRACMELAVLFYGGEDLLAAQERGGRIASETVGPISTSYFDDASSETFYPAVAGLIGDFLTAIPGEAGGDHYTMLKVVPC